MKHEYRNKGKHGKVSYDFKVKSENAEFVSVAGFNRLSDLISIGGLRNIRLAQMKRGIYGRS